MSARARLEDSVSSGRALEAFGRVIEAQGGNPAVLEDPAPAGEVAGWLAGQTKLITVARGLLYGAAAEAA